MVCKRIFLLQSKKKKVGFHMLMGGGVSCFIKSPSRNIKMARPCKYFQDQKSYLKTKSLSLSATLSGSHSPQLFSVSLPSQSPGDIDK